MAGEKTEKATPQRRQESRKKGQVAKSAEVPAALIMLGSFLLLNFIWDELLEGLLALYKIHFNQYITWELTPQTIRILLQEVTFKVFTIMLPVAAVAIVFGVLGNFVQVGSLFTTEPLKMKLEKLNPIEGAKKIFSIRSLVELLKSLLKIAIISAAAIGVLWQGKDELFLLSQKSIGQSLSYLAKMVFQLGLAASIILLCLAILDYMYQKYEFEKSIRMSKQDIQDEMKKSEGDPLIKSRIKEKQRQLGMNRMIQDLPKADVLITNPTHYAIALQYDPETMDAPMVIAMGKDHLALKIKEKAKELNIVTMENKPLARALYQTVDIGDYVPEDLFQAVAEVLAYVYRLKGKIT
ncbi:flagellar biosynthesis protein FlhB [Mesobacillus campisalis]|uniref:Flagellar biosynthetic protein FlhB n=1 Tax=Mesobacillus campisalis TaxID=1408103 RepID=A0A0M2SZ78_9BACI|nr:flagellar biosynthesis protein FlhB [Mesobacillus campisalis]KKK39006.1 flagellar biosynthesis protein FlhB [Mesobacillus campisalis]